MDISEIILEEGCRIASLNHYDAIYAINNVFNRYLLGDFKAASGFMYNNYGNISEHFGCIIFNCSSHPISNDSSHISINNTFAFIDILDTMSYDSLVNSYKRISHTKSLNKTHLSNSIHDPTGNKTLGIIYAQNIDSPLDSYIKVIEDLNNKYDSYLWPDMIVIASIGIINYSIQFPGESIAGDFLIPVKGAFSEHTVPIYVVLVHRPTGKYSFNKLLYFVLSHITVASQKSPPPFLAEISRGITDILISNTGYQPNLDGILVPVPREFYNDRYFSPLPLVIEDTHGKILSSVDFLPWQGGGVILLTGKLPIEAILIFLGKNLFKKARVINRSNLKISYVLPINKADFLNMLTKFQEHSNMRVKENPKKMIIESFDDEGSTSPYIARLMLGIMNLRDSIFLEKDDIVKFDKHYEFVITSFKDARNIAKDIDTTWNDHYKAISDSMKAILRTNVIEIKVDSNNRLKKLTEDFLNTSVRTIKYGMQKLTDEMSADIKFLYKKESSFLNGLSELNKSDLHLAKYIKESRIWTEKLITQRNRIEHTGWRLPNIKYKISEETVDILEPLIDDEPLTKYIEFMIDRIACFIEDIIVHLLKKKLPNGITISEIPIVNRSKDIPKRFTLTIIPGGLEQWHLYYHKRLFIDT